MKAAVCDVFGKPLTMKEVPTPSPGPVDLLIRVHGCGVCHSDLHLVDAVNEVLGKLRDGKVRLRAVLTPE